MRILHFSDVHIPPALRKVPFRDWFSKRIVGGLNLALLRGRHFPGVRRKLEHLATFARDEGVDLALSTGDFTVLGTDRELAEARERMQPFVDLPLGFVAIPGNHDRYAPDTVKEERYRRHFGDLLTTDLPEFSADGPWPLVRLPGPGVAVIALDSAVAHWKPWHAWGEVSETQIRALERIVDDPRVRERFMFVLVHHAPRTASGRRDKDDHGLRNADGLLEACSKIGRGAILFGHIHRCFRLELPDPGPVLYDGASTTALGREGGWLFDVEGDRATATRVRYRLNRYVLDEGERFDG